MASEISWAETGGLVGEQYRRLRQEAIDHAKARNQLFQEATRAFMLGDRKLAKDLSRQGRQHDENMRNLHRQAAQVIFTARNQQGQRSDLLDLHGLHVEEALSFLEWWLDRLHQDSQHQVCYVVTGTGHHSDHKHLVSTKQARLLPAISTYLQENGYRWGLRCPRIVCHPITYAVC